MPIHDLRHIEHGRAVWWTSIEHLEHGLQVSVQVDHRCSHASNHKLFITVVPPGVDASFRKGSALASFELKPSTV
jgi:hypothetical protein